MIISLITIFIIFFIIAGDLNRSIHNIKSNYEYSLNNKFLYNFYIAFVKP